MHYLDIPCSVLLGLMITEEKKEDDDFIMTQRNRDRERERVGERFLWDNTTRQKQKRIIILRV